MLKKILVLISLVFSVSIFANTLSANNATPSPNATQPPIVTSNKHPLVVSQGKPFTIILSSNHTTGFIWKPELSQYDQNLIITVSHRYIKPSKLLGAPGYDVWEFQPVIPKKPYAVNQVGHIKMVYAQPWSKKNVKTKMFIVVVSAKNNGN